MSTLILMALLLILNIIAATIFLWISARICLPQPIRFRRALLPLIFHLPISVALLVIFSHWSTQDPVVALFKGLAELCINSVSMAPTIFGKHFLGTCPLCNGKAVIRYDYHREEFMLERQKENGELAICENCFQINKLRNWNPEVFTWDRVICNKLIAPKRWDVMVFRYPPKPDSLYAQRLIGLPGEEVLIKEGRVWINGKKIDPPEQLKNLRWTHRVGFPEYNNLDEALKNENDVQPVRLGPNGYFVVGDFTLRSSDSCVWGEVPTENLVGGVTMIHWPPERWRIFR